MAASSKHASNMDSVSSSLESRIKKDVSRYCSTNTDIIFSTIVKCISEYDIKYSSAMVWVADFLLNGDDIFNGISIDLFTESFCNLMLIMHHGPANYSRFIGQLRSYMPELNEHFAYEGVLGIAGGDMWLQWWLQWLGIRAMPTTLLCRLWDQYFSMRVMDCSLQEVHIFNCLIIMKENTTALLELDQSEIRLYLSQVPQSIDMEAVVSEATSLRQNHKAD